MKRLFFSLFLGVLILLLILFLFIGLKIFENLFLDTIDLTLDIFFFKLGDASSFLKNVESFMLNLKLFNKLEFLLGFPINFFSFLLFDILVSV